MEDLVSMIFRPGTLVLAIAVYIITHVFRRVVETARPTLKRKATELDKESMYGSRAALWWNEVVLYVAPVVTGMVLAQLESDFIFGSLVFKERVMYACGVGWFSSVLYKTVRKALLAKAGMPDTGRESEPPPSTT